MKLTDQEKADRVRQRMIDHARQFQIGTYSRKFVAPVFQLMIRAEAAARHDGVSLVMLGGVFSYVVRHVGECACVTCGTVAPWKGNAIGGGVIETGHFLASRRNSILFDEENVAPQCKECNRHRGGEQQLFRKWMLEVRGEEIVERLERQKNEVRAFTREELVDMRIAFSARLKAAEERMKWKE